MDKKIPNFAPVVIPPNRFWLPEDVKNLNAAQTFAELLEVALLIAGRMPEEPLRAIVSAPITTGPGSIEENIESLRFAIDTLNEFGVNVFDQTVFQHKMTEIALKWHEANKWWGYCTPILQDFYWPLLSQRIRFLIQLPAWKVSYGALYEYRAFKWFMRTRSERREIHQLHNGSGEEGKDPNNWKKLLVAKIPDPMIHQIAYLNEV